MKSATLSAQIDPKRTTAKILSSVLTPTGEEIFVPPTPLVWDEAVRKKYEQFGILPDGLTTLNELKLGEAKLAHAAKLGLEEASLREISVKLGGKALPDSWWTSLGVQVNRFDGTVYHFHDVYPRVPNPAFDLREDERAAMLGYARKSPILTPQIESLSNYPTFRKERRWESKRWPGDYVRTCQFSELKATPPEAVIDKLAEVAAWKLFDYVTIFAPDSALKERCDQLAASLLREEVEKARKAREMDPVLVGVIRVEGRVRWFPIIQWV